MLTLFVVQSRADILDHDRTVESFHDLTDEVYFVPNIQEINGKPKRNEWYAVIYDDEYIDESLKEGLKIFIEQCPVDVLVLGKEGKGKFFKCPRLFRRSIILRSESLLPEKEGVEFETVLNGLIHDNN